MLDSYVDEEQILRILTEVTAFSVGDPASRLSDKAQKQGGPSAWEGAGLLFTFIFIRQSTVNFGGQDALIRNSFIGKL